LVGVSFLRSKQKQRPCNFPMGLFITFVVNGHHQRKMQASRLGAHVRYEPFEFVVARFHGQRVVAFASPVPDEDVSE
jgi:hypothetical protein